ncbi:GAP family protein [Arthrobacter sp. CG_A4]|uniref:GAP family protein n=1 Tax=Arthrobacter sp. CG_A4 TaxID=3071706 RepID=UPI002DF7BEDC|nr:cytochrome c biogenesis protein CcdA [Arthrobacter sp. CG_A4]
MSLALIGGIAALALLDSFNPATILAITLILLSVPKKPVLSALAFVSGAMITVFVLGAVIFLSAGVAAEAVAGGIGWLRRIVFLIAAITLVIVAFRRLKTRDRAGAVLPDWFSVGTAFPLGVMMTGADLPNAFPYFIAIERMINAGVSSGSGLVVVIGYALVYCLPCLLLLLLGVLHGERMRGWLQKVYDRFSTGTVKRSVPTALLLLTAAIPVAAIALWP